jgi:hypothetical protein
VQVCVLRLVPAAAALLLGACALDPYVSSRNTVSSGSWQIEHQTDRVTGGSISSAIVVTRTTSNAADVWPKPAMLQLSCFLGKPTASLKFQFKIGTNLNSVLGYRFDDKPGHEIGARFIPSSSTVVIEEPAEVAEFVKELATSSSLYVRLRSFNAGRASAEFKVDGAPAAIQSAFAQCPVQPLATPQTASLPVQRRAR